MDHGAVLGKCVLGFGLVGIGVLLAVLGAVAGYNEGVRADVTKTTGALEASFLILLLLGAAAALTGMVILFRQYERAVTRSRGQR